MDTDLLETLPLPNRLALSYAPAVTRDGLLTLWALDARLARIVQSRGEGMIAQIKLAWWRDRLGESIQQWPKGEPVLARLSTCPVHYGNLIVLVDAWEQLLAEELNEESITAHVDGRAAIWREFALAMTANNSDIADASFQAGREWAMVDLSTHLSHPNDRSEIRKIANSEPWAPAALPRKLRPFTVLHKLAHRALARDADVLLDGPGAMALAMRVGIIGR